MTRSISMIVGATAASSAQYAAARFRDAGFSLNQISAANTLNVHSAAIKLVNAGERMVVVVGGDRSIHAAVQGLAGTDTVLGIVTAGGGDEIARHWGCPTRDHAAATDAVIGGRVTSVALGMVGGTYFASSFRTERTEGASVGHGPFEPHRFKMSIEGEENDFYAVGVVARPEADGRLAVTAYAAETRRGVLVARSALRGNRDSSLARQWRTDEFAVAAVGMTGFADGVRVGPLPLNVTVKPSALRIITA